MSESIAAVGAILFKVLFIRHADVLIWRNLDLGAGACSGNSISLNGSTSSSCMWIN